MGTAIAANRLLFHNRLLSQHSRYKLANYNYFKQTKSKQAPHNEMQTKLVIIAYAIFEISARNV